MKYKAALIFSCIICGLFLIIGCGILIHAINARVDGLFYLLFGSAFIGIATSSLISVIGKDRKYRTRTYAWYRATYPDKIGHNRLHCFKCDSDRIHVHGGNQTMHREHLCTQCGTTLFYSPEG